MIVSYWELLQHRIEQTCSVISLLANLFLVHLILHKSPKQLGAYKHLLLYNTIFEICYSIITVVASPIAMTHGSTFMVLADIRNTIIPPKIKQVLIATYCGFYGILMALLGLHFLYRYLVASGSTLLKSFNDRRIYLWFSIPLIYGLIWGSNAYFFGPMKPTTSDFVKNSLLEVYGLKPEDIVYIGPCLFPKNENGEYLLDMRVVIALGVASCQLLVSFVVIFYFGIKCYMRLRRLMIVVGTVLPISTKYDKLQSQLFNALATQTLIPVILMHIPVFIVFVFTFSDKSLGTSSGIVIMSIALYPAIDPLPTIFMITSYRKATFEYFQGIYNAFGTFRLQFDQTRILSQTSSPNITV